MINVLRYNGFEKIKEEQEEKVIEMRNLDNTVNTLENSLKIIKNHFKQNEDSNTKLIKENLRLLNLGDVNYF